MMQEKLHQSYGLKTYHLEGEFIYKMNPGEEEKGNTFSHAAVCFSLMVSLYLSACLLYFFRLRLLACLAHKDILCFAMYLKPFYGTFHLV